MGIWVSNRLNLDGMRLDAIKHMNDQFIKHFLEAVRADRGEGFYAVGEYWKNDTESLEAYLSQVEYNVDLFDVALHYNLNEASEKGRDYDLRDLLKGTLVEICPDQAVTFVDNHDSQKTVLGVAGEGLVQTFRLRFDPVDEERVSVYLLWGLLWRKGKKSPHRKVLDMLLRVRKEYAYGEEVDYFDHPNTIGFVRLGDPGHADSGLAVVISNGEDGEKTMSVGRTGKARYGMRSQAR